MILPQQPSADSLPVLKLFVEDREHPVWLRGARLGPVSSLHCSLAREKVGRAGLWSKQLSRAVVGFTGVEAAPRFLVTPEHRMLRHIDWRQRKP